MTVSTQLLPHSISAIKHDFSERPRTAAFFTSLCFESVGGSNVRRTEESGIEQEISKGEEQRGREEEGERKREQEREKSRRGERPEEARR